MDAALAYITTAISNVFYLYLYRNLELKKDSLNKNVSLYSVFLLLHYFGTIFGFFFQRTADWGPVHVDSYPTSGISTRHAAHEREKMAMYRWQVTHASPKPYFASRFHYDNNNDNSNNNKIAGAEAEKRPKIFDEFIFFFQECSLFFRDSYVRYLFLWIFFPFFF